MNAANLVERAFYRSILLRTQHQDLHDVIREAVLHTWHNHHRTLCIKQEHHSSHHPYTPPTTTLAKRYFSSVQYAYARS